MRERLELTLVTLLLDNVVQIANLIFTFGVLI